MNNRLKHIQNWLELAKESNWCAQTLAKKCNVSTRTLQRYFAVEKGKSPKMWLSDERQRIAVQLLDYGYTVKEMANCLGYEHPNQLSREFKAHWGHSPTEYQRNRSHSECRELF